MDMTTEASRFVEAVKAGVASSLATLRQAHPAAIFLGYALVTDDNVGTIGHVALRASDLENTEEPEPLLFSPVDWVCEEGPFSFKSASEAFEPIWSGTDEGERFELLVEALNTMRDSFDADVFLTVFSTDPSPEMEALETAAVEKLNPPELVARAHAQYEKWDGESGSS